MPLHVEIDVNLYRHPRLLMFASRLGIDPYHAVGHLYGLWSWAMVVSEDGDLSKYDNRTIATGAGWTTRCPDEFCAALRIPDFEWIGRDGKLHAWDNWAGRLLRAMKRDADRKRTSRSNDKPVRGTSAGCPSEIRGEKEKEKEKEKERHIRSFNEQFWPAYPRKDKKPDALRAWCALKPSEKLVQTILADIEAKRDGEDWTKEARRFCPMPASYIRGRRWEDEKREDQSPDGSGWYDPQRELEKIREREKSGLRAE